MKLEKLTEGKKGTYAGVRFDDDTKKRIVSFIEKNKIPNPVPVNKIHTTVLYSRKHLPNYKPQEKVNFVGKPKKFDVWETQSDKDGKTSNALILTYDSPELVKRHKLLMDEHEATFDFDKFEPHITLSYNIGDLDISKLNPAGIGNLKIVSEYGEDLDLDWAKSNT